MLRLKELFSKLDPGQRAASAKAIGYDLSGAPADAARTDSSALAPSATEQRLWLAHRMSVDGGSYIISCAYRVRGDLDVGALSWAIERLIERHEALRTSFVVGDGNMRISVVPTAPAPLTLWDVARHVDPEVAIERHLVEQSVRSFDLSQAPLFRAFVGRIDARDHIFQLVMHHIIADQWSLEVFRRELFALYDARHFGETPYLPQVAPTPRRSNPGGEMAEDMAYWVRTLAGVQRYPDLPFDQPPSRSARWIGDRLYIDYGDLGEDLARLAIRHSCTSFMVLVAAFALVYARWIGSNDVCIGTRVAGRSRPETRNVMGFFVNLLALRWHIPEDAGIDQWLGMVRDGLLEAFDHQDVAFESVLANLSIERDALVTPLIPVIITHQNIPVQAGAEMGGLNIEPLRYHNGTAKCELDLAFEGQGASLELAVEFRTDIFTPQTIRSLIDEHRAVLRTLIAAPDARLRSIRADLDTRTAASPILVGPRLASGESVDARIQRLALADPNRVAVLDRYGETSIGEIEAQSRRLAWELMNSGEVSADRPVGLYMERSSGWLIAALALLRANIVYVPLDPHYPEEFTRETFARSGVRLLLTEPALRERAQAFGGRLFICSEEAKATASEASATLPPVDNDLRQPAYIAYTSGSTGEPKGIVVEHRQVLNCVDSFAAFCPVADDESIGQMTSISFAPSIKEWLTGLFAGRPVVVIDQEQSVDMKALDQLVTKYRVTRLNMVPTKLRLLVDYKKVHPAAFDALRIVVTAGAPLDAPLVADFHAAFSNCRLFNNYGCTEANDICYFELPAGVQLPEGFAPAGTPIANFAVGIFDSDLQPVRAGAVGEICVFGAGVGAGYYRSPDETARTFCPSSRAGDFGQRMLRTGDYGRIRGDNVLELHGRRDQQIKINGCRVDVRHVEAVLRRHPDVERCIVLARQLPQRDPQMVAYITPALDPDRCAGIRLYMAENLPRHMVPSAVVALDAFPLLSNGKFDRLGLPQASSAPPREMSDIERRIAAIWVEILAAAPESPDVDFFVIGGNSLHLTQCVARFREVFGVEVSLNDLFAASTLTLQANLIDRLRAGSTLAP